MAVLAIGLVVWGVPAPVRQKANRETVTAVSRLGQVFETTGSSCVWIFGIFTLHFVLMALFIHLPVTLQNLAGLPREQHWWVYLLAMVVSFAGMVPFIIIGEKTANDKSCYGGSHWIASGCPSLYVGESEQLAPVGSQRPAIFYGI